MRYKEVVAKLGMGSTCPHQLCMKDIQKEIPVITTAATVVEKLVGYYEKFPEKAADLQAAQVALKLIRPGNTRWNSFVDSWIRAVEASSFNKARLKLLH